MELLTWNIQAGCGADGVTDLDRIVGVISEMGNPDIICLQEVALNFPVVDGGRGENQVATLRTKFPQHDACFGAAIDCVDIEGARMGFGNLILSRLPVKQRTRHQLPRRADPDHFNMPRGATEVIVEEDSRLIRIITTHLEYFSNLQRRDQVSRIRGIVEESSARARSAAAKLGPGPYSVTKETRSTIVCGDFNFTPENPEYKVLTTTDSGCEGLSDAWCVNNGSRRHPATCGIFDRDQWPEGPHCRDFFFLTSDLSSRVVSLEVNSSTDASDHQPVRLILE